MYQTVGHQGIDKLAEAMEVPLYRKETFGRSSQTGKYYEPTENDEVEDLFDLLKQIKVKYNLVGVKNQDKINYYQCHSE